MLRHVQSEVSNEHCTPSIKMIDCGGEDTKYKMIKTEIKQEPELSECTEEMENHSFTCVEHLKSEQSEYRRDMHEPALEDMNNIESQGSMENEKMKYEVLVEALDIKEHGLIYIRDGQHEESEDAECLKAAGVSYTMLSHVQSEVSNEHCTHPTKIIGGEDIKYKMIKTEIKQEPELSQCTEEMKNHSFTCVERLKSEQSEYRRVMHEPALEDMNNIKSQGSMDYEKMKYEVLVEALDIKEHKLIYKGDGQHEESEDAECLKPADGVSAEKCNQALLKNINESTLVPGGKNIPEQRTHRTVKVESSIKSIGTHMLRSTETTEINSHVKINTSMYTAIDRCNINSYNNCIDTNIDVDNSNSTHCKIYISNDGDEDKNLKIRHIDHDIVKNKCNRERWHEREQRPCETGVVNKQTETYTQNIHNECEICQRQFNYTGNLKRHLKTHTGIRAYGCEKCQEKFYHKGSLKLHLRTHIGEKPFECKICQRKFNQGGNLKAHLRTHTEEKPFECMICKRKFNQAEQLMSHLSSHTGEKPFECEICELRFKQKGNLKRHMRIHTDEKSFECELCHQKFNQEYLKTHLRTHTSEKPFECKICQVKFNQKCNLNRHLRTHTGEKPFECDKCRRKFNQAEHLRSHLRTHTRKSPFECEICKVRFKHKCSLNRHLRTHTGN